MPQKNQYWLMKSEPDVYSIHDLKRDGKTSWEGVRNYQARNFMRDAMQVGDRVLFYHSNAKPPGVAGIGRVCSRPYPDPTAWDPSSPYQDPKSTEDKPVWFLVDVAFAEAFEQLVPLDQLKTDPALEGLMVTRRGMRLSIQPVSAAHFNHILKRGRLGAGGPRSA